MTLNAINAAIKSIDSLISPPSTKDEEDGLTGTEVKRANGKKKLENKVGPAKLNASLTSQAMTSDLSLSSPM